MIEARSFGALAALVLGTTTWACTGGDGVAAGEQAAIYTDAGCVDEPGSDAQPEVCTLAGFACGWGSVLFTAQEVYSQITPGCGGLELGSTLVLDGLATDWENGSEAAAIWACNVLSCVKSPNPYVLAAQAACASGNALASLIRCQTLTSQCEAELAAGVGIGCEGIEAHYPCPYAPTAQACGPYGPRTEEQILSDCGRIVEAYPDVEGPTAGVCIAGCVNRTRDAAEDCTSGSGSGSGSGS